MGHAGFNLARPAAAGQLSAAPHRTAGVDVELIQPPQQGVVDFLGHEETAAAGKLHGLTRQKPVPASVPQSCRKDFVEEITACRGKIDAAACTINGSCNVV